MPTLAFRPAVITAREMLAAGRKRLAEQHAADSPGIQVCAALTDLFDEIVLELIRDAVEPLSAEDRKIVDDEIAFVAIGGYGRRDVAPYSDVDLMILHTRRAERLAGTLTKRVIQDLYDTGLIAGQSLRTPAEAVAMALTDASIFTALVEARHVAGSEAMTEGFRRKFHRRTRSKWRKLISQIVDARAKESAQFGETVYLLEPNVKRSPGGLRGIQLVRWIGFARYGRNDPESLHLAGELHQEDRDALRRASEFLLRVRNELQFHSQKAHDVLDKVEQVRIAERFGYAATEALLPVERFMQEYFRHTQAVRQITTRFVEGAQPYRRLQEWLGPLISFSLAGRYRVGPHSITATRLGQTSLRKNLSEVLKLAHMANSYDKRIDHRTWKAVRESVAQLKDDVTPESRREFLLLLDNPARLGELLRTLHELGVLEKLIPPFAHARSLLQFNEYHKYTVDEHTLRAVECATRFAERDDTLGKAYRDLRDKRLLHFALLIHDLGKGFLEDHSEIGRRMALEIAKQYELDEHETGLLAFLVHKHLSMSHLAFRRDTSDSQVVLRFAREVGSPEALSMLYVLTCADISAVGPGVFNDWKCEVLSDLYRRSLAHLSGDASSDAGRRRAELDALFAGDAKAGWFRRRIDALPESYLSSAPPEQLADELRRLDALHPGESRSWSRYLPESRTVEYVVGTHESVATGIFHKLTGALSGQGLQILGADIHTFADGLVLDRFHVIDPDYAEAPAADRLERVDAALLESLKSDQPPTFRRIWQSSDRKAVESLVKRPAEFHTDNNTSARHTILDIFANDRRGLLYAITRKLYDLGLSVSTAKIGTYVDQVVDVFYVNDAEGRKIEDERRLRDIRDGVLQAIAELEAGS